MRLEYTSTADYFPEMLYEREVSSTKLNFIFKFFLHGIFQANSPTYLRNCHQPAITIFSPHLSPKYIVIKSFVTTKLNLEYTPTYLPTN